MMEGAERGVIHHVIEGSTDKNKFDVLSCLEIMKQGQTDIIFKDIFKHIWVH